MRLMLVLFGALLFCGNALAAFPTASPFGNQRSIPTVQEAMPLSVTQENGVISLRFTLMDNVYLYRPQIKLVPYSAADKALPFPKAPALPEGKPHEDAIYGKTEVYFHQLVLQVPKAGLPDNTAYLRVHYQGCLQDVLCYPPQQHDIAISADSASNQSITSASHPTQVESPDVWQVLQSGDANQFANWAQSQSLAYVLLLFFIGGLLMAFTPCVFPMFPILLGILAGNRNPHPARGFIISLAYVLGMAVPFMLLGLLVALTGAGLDLKVWLQQPLAISIAAIIFVLLALSMFGLYDLQLPGFLRPNHQANPQGSLPQAVIMGAVSALVVSPCITPVLAGAMIFVAIQGNLVTGILAFLFMAIGMGVPLLIIGAGGASLLPKAGDFMNDIKHFFGLILLLMAIWLLGRIIDPTLSLWLYGAVLLVYAVTLGAFGGVSRFRQGIAVLILAYASLLLAGAATGGKSLFTPLATLQPTFPSTGVQAVNSQTSTTQSAFTEVAPNGLAATLAAAARDHRPVLVDFYADWCTACKELEETTLSDPAVLAAMQDITLLRVDISEMTAVNSQLMRQYHILGLPCLIFFDEDGEEITSARVLGYMDSAQWLKHLKMHVNPAI